MAFVPTFKVSEISRTSSYFKVEDTTPTYIAPSTNPTGYGVLGGPQDVDAISDLRILVQYTGEEPVELSSALQEGSILTDVKATYALRDGVSQIHLLYGMECTLDPGNVEPVGYSWEVIDNTGRKKLQVTVGGTAGVTVAEALGGVTHIRDMNSPTKPLIKVKNLDADNGILELYEAFYEPTVADVDIQLSKYYTATVRVLLVNDGEAGIVKDIANMAITNCTCDHSKSKELIERILLKLAAQTAFNCGNYVKAHNAATLLSKQATTIKPCATC